MHCRSAAASRRAARPNGCAIRCRWRACCTGSQPHVFSATQVARGKPAPDLFLFAAASMHADPAACVVIEDSVPGVQAAVAAGMRVIGFTGGGHCRPGHAERLLAAGAAAIADDMRRLPALVSPA